MRNNKSNDISLLTECACVVDDNVWYFMYTCNSLNWLNIKTGECGSVGDVPWEDIDGCRLYSTMYYYKSKLVLVPFFANNITIYDLNENKFYMNDRSLRASASYISGGNIYIIPMYSEYGDGILKYDIDENVLEELVNTSCIRNTNHIDTIWSTNILEKDNKIFSNFGHTDKYLVCDVENKECEVRDIPGAIARNYGMIWCNDDLFSLDFDKARAVVFSTLGDIIEEIEFGITFESEKEKYTNVFRVDGKIIVNYTYRPEVYEIDERSHHFICLYPNELIQGLYGQAIAFKNSYLFLPTSERDSWMWKDGEIRNGSIPMTTRTLSRVLKKRIVTESNDISLKNLIDVLKIPVS